MTSGFDSSGVVVSPLPRTRGQLGKPSCSAAKQRGRESKRQSSISSIGGGGGGGANDVFIVLYSS